nr:MAG TPA: hypothetical protein [Caudoviricetes sp.]
MRKPRKLVFRLSVYSAIFWIVNTFFISLSSFFRVRVPGLSIVELCAGCHAHERQSPIRLFQISEAVHPSSAGAALGLPSPICRFYFSRIIFPPDSQFPPFFADKGNGILNRPPDAVIVPHCLRFGLKFLLFQTLPSEFAVFHLNEQNTPFGQQDNQVRLSFGVAHSIMLVDKEKTPVVTRRQIPECRHHIAVDGDKPGTPENADNLRLQRVFCHIFFFPLLMLTIFLFQLKIHTVGGDNMENEILNELDAINKRVREIQNMLVALIETMPEDRKKDILLKYSIQANKFGTNSIFPTRRL